MNNQYLMRQYVLFKDGELVGARRLDFKPEHLEPIAYYLKPENANYELLRAWNNPAL